MPRIVYYKLQTTHRTTWAQIVSIGAISRIPGTKEFDRFQEFLFSDRMPVSLEAKEINGLSLSALLLINALPPKEGLRKFVAFLEGLQSEELILVSYKIKEPNPHGGYVIKMFEKYISDRA